MKYFKALRAAYARLLQELALEAQIGHLQYQHRRRGRALIRVSWYRESDLYAGEYLTRSPRDAARVALRRKFTGCETEITI